MGATFYLDTSAVIPLLVDDVHTPAMQAWVASEMPAILLSDYAAAEFGAVIARNVRMRRLSSGVAVAILADFDQWRAQTAEPRATRGADVTACERLVRNFPLNLTAPDALHLAMAMADGVPLVAFDQRLIAAARALGHPAVWPAPPGE